VKRDLDGLGNINIELTSRCNKDCWMCGRRKVDREYPELVLEYGDINFQLLEKIARQLPPNIVVQLHNNGESLLYPRFGDAVKLFSNQITNVVTNGKLLVAKADEIIDNLDTLAISIIENDPEADEQYGIIEDFLKIKEGRKPFTVLRLNGKINQESYRKFGLVMATRVLHSPMGSFGYKKDPTIPEIGICLDFLHHLAVDSKGMVSICVRFDPNRVGVVGDANLQSLEEIWDSSERLKWLECHKQGERDKVPLCSSCHFWGVPTGNPYGVVSGD
jgi:radical SAM protein with 4Fe4S-binding SPASM domain